MANNNQPAFSKRDGAVKVTVWSNDTDNGTFYAANVERSYKDEQDEWQTTSQLSGTDMLKASRLLEQAYDESVVLRSK